MVLNYELNEWKLDLENRKSLAIFLESSEPESITKIAISGHTDAKGDDNYNQELSKKRAETVKREVIKMGYSESLIKLDFFGENRLIEKVEGKNKTNRRVEVSVYLKKRNSENTLELLSIEKILSKMADPPQQFCINNNRDTFIRGEQGTVVFIKANSIAREDGSKITNCVQLELKEAFSKSDMLLNNLTTTSNDKLLESEGMFSLTPSPQNVAPLRLVKDYVAFVPTDSVRDDVQVLHRLLRQEQIVQHYFQSLRQAPEHFQKSALLVLSSPNNSYGTY